MSYNNEMGVVLQKCLLLVLAMAITGCSGSSSTQGCSSAESFSQGLSFSRPQGWSQVEHVVVIVLENTEFAEVSKQPYQASLIARGGHLKNSYGVTRPSQPNYLALVGGDTFGINHSNEVNLSETHLGDLLEAKGKTWKVYAEGFPGSCDLSMVVGDYVRRHVPFLNFTNVTTNPTRCAKIVSSSGFSSDVSAGQLPNFSLYVPNNRSNGHDTSAAFADQWLQTEFAAKFDDPVHMSSTLYLITYDEGGLSGASENRIYSVFLGAGVRPGSSTETCINHYGILGTLESIFETGSLGRKDVAANRVSGIWL